MGRNEWIPWGVSLVVGIVGLLIPVPAYAGVVASEAPQVEDQQPLRPGDRPDPPRQDQHSAPWKPKLACVKGAPHDAKWQKVCRPTPSPTAKPAMTTLAGTTVTLTPTILTEPGGRGMTVQLDATTDYPMDANDVLAIYEPNYANTNKLVAFGAAGVTNASKTVTPRAASGEWVAVVSNGPAPLAYATTGWLAQSAAATSEPWRVWMNTADQAESNYKYGNSTAVLGDAKIALYNRTDPVPANSKTGQCGIAANDVGHLCSTYTSSQPHPCGVVLPIVTTDPINELYPADEKIYARGKPLPCPPPEPSSLSVCQACLDADPVNTASGAFTEQFTDVSIRGRGFGLQLVRTYNSNHVANQGAFGYGWSSTFEARLKLENLNGSGSLKRATFTDPLGSSELFHQVPNSVTADGVFESADGVFGGLVYDAATGRYKLSDWRRGIAYTFSQRSTDPSIYDLAAITDRNGKATTFTWGTNKITVTDSSNRVMTINFSGAPTAAASRVTSVVDPMNRTNAYVYTSGDLTSAQDASKVIYKFTYGTAHRILTRTTANGAGGTVTNAYDTSGRVISQTLVKTTGGTGFVTTFDYGTLGQYTAAGATTTVTRRIGATANPALDPVTKYNYVNGQVMSATTDFGTSQAATTTYNVRAPGTFLATSVTDPMLKTSLYEYDVLGNVTKTTDPLGHITQATYNSWNQLTCSVGAVRYAAGVTCPVSGAAVPLGAAGWTYDANGNLTSTTDPLGNTTIYSRGDTANKQDVTSVTDAENRVFGFTYDAYGNLAGTTSTPEVGTTLTTQAVYNANSQLTCTVGARQKAAGVVCPPPTVTPVPAGAGGMEYDANGRVSATQSPTGARTTYAYDADANVTTITDPLTVTTLVYDRAHRVTSAKVTTTGTATMTTTTAYDLPKAAGSACDPVAFAIPNAVSCSTVTDPAAKVTTYYYTSRGELAGLKTPGGFVQSASYRKDGRHNVATLQGGRTLTYAYNDDGALTSTTSSVAGTTPVNYTYRADGLRETMTDASGPTTYGYNNAGLLTSVVNSSGTTGYTWDNTNRLETITYPSGRLVTRGYDGAGRFTTVNDGAPAGGNTTTFRLDADGLIKQIEYPNTNKLIIDPTVDATTGRDAVGGLKGAKLKNSAGADLAGFTWARNTLSKVTNESTNIGGVTGGDAYLYDKAKRLTTAAGATTPNYTFDTGNHLTKIGGPTLTYNTNGTGRLATRVSGGQTRTFTYTNGNLTANAVTTGTGTGYTYAWNGHNQMASATATTSGGVATTTNYTYDGDNLRLASTTTGTTTRFAYDQTSSVPLLIKEGTRDYIYGPDGLPIEHINADNTGATYYTHDQHGDTRILADSNGNANGAAGATFTHTPYGISTKTGPESTTLLYGTGHTDPETGLVYLINRYLDPTTGNFTSTDPLLPLTGTPYAYGANNPLNTIDPLGLCSKYDPTCYVIEGLKEKIKENVVDPVKEAVEWPLEHTVGICGNGSVGYGNWIAINGCFAIVGGQPTILRTTSGGLSSPTGGLTTNVLVANATDRKQLTGECGTVGFGVGEGAVVSADYSQSSQGVWSIQIGFGAGVKVPIPFDLHGGGSYTW